MMGGVTPAGSISNQSPIYRRNEGARERGKIQILKGVYGVGGDER